MAIDFEGTHNLIQKTARSTDRQIGSAILDSKDLALSTPLKPEILTLSFVSGSARYQRKALMKFQFGLSMAIEQADLLSSIKEIIPKGRDIVLVGHGIRNELRILTSIGFDFDFMRIAPCLDTYRIRAEVLPNFSLSLRTSQEVVVPAQLAAQRWERRKFYITGPASACNQCSRFARP